MTHPGAPVNTCRRTLVAGAAAGLAASVAAPLAGCTRPRAPNSAAPVSPSTATASQAAPSSATQLRIAIASCTDQTKPQPIWDAALAERPDYFVFAGDNVYASEQPFSVDRLQAAYALQGQVANFNRLRHTVPHTATWDDHDYGLNDGGADFAHKVASKDAFLRFWQVAADDERRGRDGMYHARLLQAGAHRVQVIVLDTRWWRSKLKPTDQRGAPGKERYVPDADPAKTMLGAAQWLWLEQRLAAPADAHVVISSIQLVADGHGFERWGNLPLERERFFRAVRSSGARGVVVASGDRHIGGLYRHDGPEPGYPLWEMTSSGVTHPWRNAKEAGPNRVGPLVTDQHYGVIGFDFSAGTVTLSLRGTGNQPLHEQQVSLHQLRPS